MKLGISVKIDVTKIDKARLFKGEKGTYLDLTTFIDTEQEGQYGDHGFISQSVSKEEREQKIQTPILGNVCSLLVSQRASLIKRQVSQIAASFLMIMTILESHFNI
jgi:hypothetical protein